MSILSQSYRIWSKSGILVFSWRLFSYIYKGRIRPYLPMTTRLSYAGLPVAGRRKLGDGWITPFLYMPPPADIPDYEAALILALKDHVLPGDRVVIVGGGIGVTSVIAAQLAGEKGQVVCYEGNRENAVRIKETCALNGVSDRVDVKCAIVGPNIGVYGSDLSELIVSPRDLDECDVLELDCEGSELTIVTNMSIKPRSIAVETHGLLGSSSRHVQDALCRMGYSVEQYGPAEPSLKAKCLLEDIMVLAGNRISPPEY